MQQVTGRTQFGWSNPAPPQAVLLCDASLSIHSPQIPMASLALMLQLPVLRQLESRPPKMRMAVLEQVGLGRLQKAAENEHSHCFSCLNSK